MERNLIVIDESKCDGCGLCINACHEGAIMLVNGVAKLISDEYCDGLGNCLPECPKGAITLELREGLPFNEEKVAKKMKSLKSEADTVHRGEGCMGSRVKVFKREERCAQSSEEVNVKSELSQWPVQISLVNPNAGFLKGADVLIAADCTAYAYGNFHNEFIKDHITLIGCPKLDDIDSYREKFIEILENSNIKSLTVTRMEVPCCMGIVKAVKDAMLISKTIVPYREVIISCNGEII